MIWGNLDSSQGSAKPVKHGEFRTDFYFFEYNLLIWNSGCGPVPSPVSLRGFLISPLVEVIIQMAIREMQLSDSWW